MLTSLRIQGFQNHVDFKIEFDSNVTVLVGKSDSGKSAVLRALRWLFMNRPKGDGFIHWEAKNAKVRLEVDGHVIVRQKGKKGNVYWLDDRKFQAFGNTVPEEITHLLNVGEINYQSQHTPHFLFNKTPGEVAKELNQVVALDVIDRVLGDVTGELRKAKTVVEVSRDSLLSARKEKSKLFWVKRAAEQFRFIEHLNGKLVKHQERSTLLNNLVEEYRKSKKNVDSFSIKLRGISERFADIEQQLSQVKNLESKRELLSGLVAEYEVISRRRDDLIVKAKIIGRDMDKKMRGKLCPVCGGKLSDRARDSED